MRSTLLPLFVTASLALSGAAFAGTTAATASAKATPAVTTVSASAASSTTGTIKKIDMKAMYVVLSDGWRYHLPSGFDLSGFKVGEKVSVTFQLKGKHHDVTAMKAA